MNIDINTHVSLLYELRQDNESGELIQEVDPAEPFEFVYGTGYLLPAFEDNILGLKANDTFSFNLTAKNAYGEVNPAAIVDLPLSVFEVDGKVDEEMVKIGNIIPMRNQNGQSLQGHVIGLTDTTVSMDFNHPLAGKDLHFSGSIVDVRQATESELSGGGHCAPGGCGGGCSCG